MWAAACAPPNSQRLARLLRRCGVLGVRERDQPDGQGRDQDHVPGGERVGHDLPQATAREARLEPGRLVLEPGGHQHCEQRIDRADQNPERVHAGDAREDPVAEVIRLLARGRGPPQRVPGGRLGLGAGQLHARAQAVRCRGVGPAASGGDPMPRAARGLALITRVVVLVAGQRQCDLGPCVRHQRLLDVAQGLPRSRLHQLRRRIGLSVGPARLRRRDDHAVAALQFVARGPEVGELRAVDVGVELDVGRPEPPAIGEPEGEVAALLLGPPAPDPVALAEKAHEARQPVVPVVVAGDRVHVRLVGLGDKRQGRPIGTHEPVPIGVPVRRRVDLVTAEHEQPPATGLLHAGGGREAQRRRGEQPRHCVRRVEALTDVGGVVDPQRAVGIAIGDVGAVGGQPGLDLALVGEACEQPREEDLEPGPEQERRPQPVDHRLAVEAQLGLRDRARGPARAHPGRPR